MKMIKLTQSKMALVDDEDFKQLNQYNWYACRSRNGWRAARMSKRKMILMHRQIMKFPIGFCIDHKNHNELDNQKSNLRIATCAENLHNMQKHKPHTSIYKGVHWNKRVRKWLTQICYNYKRITLGYFNSEIEAAKTYNKKAKELFGKFV